MQTFEQYLDALLDISAKSYAQDNDLDWYDAMITMIIEDWAGKLKEEWITNLRARVKK